MVTATERTYWMLAGAVAAVVVIGAVAGLFHLAHRHSQEANTPKIPDLIYHRDVSPAANAAARSALIEKIKTDHDPQWLKFGCLQYNQENDEMNYVTKARGMPPTQYPSCRDLNPLAPADAATTPPPR
jgi:hypothetical protein